MARIEWNVNVDAGTPVLHPNSFPVCVRWFTTDFRDFFVKELKNKLDKNQMELSYLNMGIKCKYSAGLKPTKQVLEYRLFTTVIRKGDGKSVKIIIYSDTINLAKLNKVERIKYLCGLTFNIINNIVMLAKAGMVIESKSAPTLEVSSIRNRNTEYVNFSIKTNHFKLIIGKLNAENRKKPNIIVNILLGKDKNSSIKTIRGLISNVLEWFKLIEWNSLEPLQIISMNLVMSPEVIIKKIGKVLYVFRELAKKDAIGLPEQKLLIFFFGKGGYKQDIDGNYIWEDKLTVWTNAKLRVKAFNSQMTEKDEYYGETGTVFSI